MVLGNLIYEATKSHEYLMAGSISLLFLLISFLVINFKGSIKNFEIDLEDKNLSVNQKKTDEPEA